MSSMSSSSDMENEIPISVKENCLENCSSELPKSTRVTLLIYPITAGVLHLCIFNTIVTTGQHLETCAPGINAARAWMPCGTLGTLCGTICYFLFFKAVRIRNIFLGYMALLILFLSLIAIVSIAHLGLIPPRCAMIVGCFITLLMETARGILMCHNFGLCSLFDRVGLTNRMSVHISVGESLSAFLPWATVKALEEIFNYDGTSRMSFYICLGSYALGIVNILHVIFWLLINFMNPKKSEAKRIVDEARIRRLSMASEEELKHKMKHKETVWTRWKNSIPGTRISGLSFGLVIGSWLNVYPHVIPYGYGLPVTESTKLLGFYICIDPIARLCGLVLPTVMRGRKFPKKTYSTMMVVRSVIIISLSLYPYFNPDNPYINSFKAYAIVIGIMSVSTSFGIVLGCYTYVSNIPDTRYKTTASSLLVVYGTSGSLTFQLLGLMYPAIKAKMMT